MKFIIAFLGLASLAAAQFEEPVQRWNGPLAGHVNGQLVPETPEVAAARAQHLRAVSEALAVLPELPPEIRYQMTGVVIPQHQQVHNHQNYVNNPQPFIPVARHEPIHTSPQFTQFAEEIPRSPIGEVPEVHAARVAHLAAYNAAKSALPKLSDAQTHSFPVAPHQQPAFPFPGSQIPIQDTPEVAAAKAAHAQAVAAAQRGF